MKKINLTLLLSIFLMTAALADEVNYKVRKFDRIYLKGPFEVELIQSDDYKVNIEAPEKYMEDIQLSDDNGTLTIDFDRKWKDNLDIEIQIYFRDIEELKITGAVDLYNASTLTMDNFKIQFKGAGKIDMDVHCNKLITEISGVGDFDMTGKAEYHKVTFSGVGDYDASKFIAENTSVNSNGVGSVSVYASEKLIANASGIGSVEFYGNPKYKDVSTSGLGSVKNRD